MAPALDTLSDLLFKLTTSLQAATSALPESESALPPQNGISLLDVKSELFLSYLQNLAFLILLKLRHGSNRSSQPGKAGSDEKSIHDETVKKLVELRIYLEKGVRPLEGRLKYQIDKVVRAADTAERDGAQKSARAAKAKNKNKSDGSATAAAEDDSGEEEGEDDDGDDETSSVDDLSYRPNLSAFQAPANTAPASNADTSSKSAGVYRPPRITPTSLPTTTNPDDRARARGARRPLRSQAIDDYISNEVSSAPTAEPSIGSTIVSGGRTTQSAKERREDSERTAYEEANFVRLPPLSKKEKARRGGRRELGFGGEELRGLGAGLDRVGRLTATTKKRREGRAIEDGPRGEGFDGSSHAGKKRKVGGR